MANEENDTILTHSQLDRAENAGNLTTISRRSGRGSLSEATTNALVGLNHLGQGVPTAKNKDNKGLTFFTRPCLNLSYDNLTTDRRLTPFITNKPDTIPFMVRGLLDPHPRPGARNGGLDLDSPLVDFRNPFIPFLTNLLTNISGWPDETMDMYTSKPGFFNEVYSLVDHVPQEFGSFDLTATFRNIQGNPISALMTVWLQYSKAVSYGTMLPYPEMIANRRVDNQTRIYRLVTDPSRRWIQHIACTGAAVPYANPMGTTFNYSDDSPNVTENDTVSLPFKCVGYMYNDPIIIRTFNETVERFNPAMFKKVKDDKGVNDVTVVNTDTMVKLTSAETPLFNYYGYPYITDDMELQWYVTKAQYDGIKTGTIG